MRKSDNNLRITNNTQINASIPNETNTNYFAALQSTLYDEDDDDEATILVSNVSRKHGSDNATVTMTASSDDESSMAPAVNKQQALPLLDTHATTTRQQNYAIFDSGATAHFPVDGTHVINRHPAHKPLTIRLPNGKHILSTHTSNLDIPWLPHTITEAHIVSG